MIEIKGRYNEVFEVEIDGWCYGLSHFSGEISAGLVHSVIKELAPSLREAILHNVAFDVSELGKKFSKAAKYLVSDREIAFYILLFLPNPSAADLDDDARCVIGMVVDRAEQVYGDGSGSILARLERKWGAERRAVRELLTSPESAEVPTRRAA